MATITFDTLKLARRLEAAGFAREQAAGAAEAFADVIGEAVVTREHLDHRLGEMESRLDHRLGDMDAKFERRFSETDARIATTEANIRVYIADTRTELLKWVVGLLLGQTAIIAALVKLL